MPKRDLVMGLQVMFEERKLEIAASLRDAATLVGELMSMRVSLSAKGHDRYAAASGAREGPHDDIVPTVALAAWRARWRGELLIAWEPRRALDGLKHGATDMI